MLTTVRAALALQLVLLTLHPATWACSHSQNSHKLLCCVPADARLAPFSCTSAHRGTLLALQIQARTDADDGQAEWMLTFCKNSSLLVRSCAFCLTKQEA